LTEALTGHPTHGTTGGATVVGNFESEIGQLESPVSPDFELEEVSYHGTVANLVCISSAAKINFELRLSCRERVSVEA